MRSGKYNRGFSLVETIAVIVVLSIIAIIAIPNVLRVIQKSKLNGIEDTTKLLAKAAQDYWIENQLDNVNLQKVSLTDETLDYDGMRPEVGYAYFDEYGHIIKEGLNPRLDYLKILNQKGVLYEKEI